ncbi:MAG: AMP-binding protein [Clostridia bacterium]|nr:AMP-binding protein [Clostridia bacterium]
MVKRGNYAVRPINDLKDMLQQSQSLFGDTNAFFIKNKEDIYKAVSYTEFKNDVDALGTALTALGLKGMHIALIGENRYEWCVSYLSIVNGTGVVVPLDKELPGSEIENLLIKSKAEAVIYSEKFHNEMCRISRSTPYLKHFICMDTTGIHQDEPVSASAIHAGIPSQTNVSADSFKSFNQLVERGKILIDSGNKSFIDAKIDSDAMNMLLFTSGTTDYAKGVMLSHKNICFDIIAVLSTVYIDSNDSSLSILPIHHTYECSLGFLALIYSGATISFNEGLKHIAKNLREIKPTVLLTVPLILESMHKKIWDQVSKKRVLKLKLKLAIFISTWLLRLLRIDLRRKLFKQIHDTLGGRIRLVLTGAAAIDPGVSKCFRSMGIPVLQGYGLTECSPLVIGNRDYAYKDSSVGLPLPGVEVKIDAPDENGVGELMVKGDNVMIGYFENQDATDKVLKGEWFCTGDLGYSDKSGFYYITGRKKNVIVTKNGKNIFPEEIESYINKSSYVLESLVWGEYDGNTGDTTVNAQIVPDFATIKEKLKLPDISKEDILRVIKEEIKNINKNMPIYKRIRDFSIRENEFIKTTTKKIKRYV